jgi:hypothetical protein
VNGPYVTAVDGGREARLFFAGVDRRSHHHLVQQAGAARAALAGYLAPGVAVILGKLLLNESLTVNEVAGLVLTGRPGDEDVRRVKELVVAGLARGDNVFDVVLEVRPLYPAHITFPGEVFLAMTVDVLDIGGFTTEKPLDYEDLRERLLPEVQLRGRSDHDKNFYTLITPPALRGGLAPDLVGEIRWWQADDYWEFALYALVLYIRAAAERLDTPVTTVCRMLAKRHGLALP